MVRREFDAIKVKDQLGKPDNIGIFGPFKQTENAIQEEQPTVLMTNDVTGMAVWDNPASTWDGVNTDDQWDSYNFTNAVIAHVVNYNNTFVWRFTHEDAYDDSGTQYAFDFTDSFTSSVSISYINYTYAGTAGATGLTATKPTNTQEGDYMFAVVTQFANQTITVPSGWTLLAQHTPSQTYRLYYKVAGASEPANYTWTFAASVKAMVITTTYRVTGNVQPITIISNTAYATSNTTVRAAAMTVPTANSALIYFGAVYRTSSTTFTKPANIGSDAWTENMDAGNTTPDFWFTTGSMTWTGSGSTGNIDIIANTTNTTKHAFAIALEPLVWQSKSVFKDITNSQIVSSAAVSVEVTSGTPSAQLSANGGVNWENVTLNEVHVFTYPGSDLRVRILGIELEDILKVECQYTI